MKLRLTIAMLLASVSLLAARADEPWQWPVAGSEAGTGILYKPQTYIGSELNFSNLVIGAPLGSDVVAPADGTIVSLHLTYLHSLNQSASSDVDFDMDLDTAAKEFAEQGGPQFKPKYITHSIGMRTSDGRTIYIVGIELARPFKTGENVKRGEKVGTVRYSYHKIEEPSISLSVSKAGKVSDPMSPFGIESSFIAPEQLKPVTELTADEAREDVNTLIDAFIECYPSLDDLISREELERYRRSTTEAIDGTISIEEFNRIMSRTNALLHDSHVTYWREKPASKPEYWDVQIGRVGDGIKVSLTNTGFEQYYGRTVTAVDGIPADSVLRHTARYIGGYDAEAEDYVKFMQFGMLQKLYLDYFPDTAADRSYTLTFDNGETLKVRSHIYKGEKVHFTPSRRDFIMTNAYEGRNFDFRMIDDSTAYVGLATFSLSEVETEQIRDFIVQNHSTPHLIFDVRNNGGGDEKVLGRLLSYCSDKPYAAVEGYSKVCRRGGFSSFAHARNYTADMTDIFGDEYVNEEGSDGLYARGEKQAIMPDSVAHYGGKLYVLTNEISASASTLFPAAVVRSHRGVVVGRETRTAYHYMTALKFVDICLPNSRITWRIPLVKCVYDETISPRIPYGRGVVPDYYVPLTLEEVAFTDGDAILNRALQLIRDGEYLGENPFAEIDAEKSESLPAWAWWAAGAAAMCIVLMMVSKRSKK